MDELNWPGNARLSKGKKREKGGCGGEVKEQGGERERVLSKLV